MYTVYNITGNWTIYKSVENEMQVDLLSAVKLGAERYEPMRTINYLDNGDEKDRLYLMVPKKEKHFATVVFIHGGGLTEGDPEFPGELLDGRWAAAMVDYRLCPNVKPTDCLTDAAAAVAWVIRHIADFGGDPNRIFVGGMSAGCYLAALVGMNPEYLAAYGLDHRKIAGLLLISGQMSTHFYFKTAMGYTGENALPVIDRYAPLYHLNKDLPPVIAVTGASGLDIPGRPEENALMVATLKALGHPSAEHYALAGHDHGGTMCACGGLLVRFIERLLGVSA